PDVATLYPSELLQSLAYHCNADVRLDIIPGDASEQGDPPHAPVLLCPYRQRPRRRRGATKEREEGTAVHRASGHSITSSVMASSCGGTVRPSRRAVSALMTSSNLLDCTTGRSAGFVPLRMRPA